MLTATQKIELHSAHSRYMVAECGSQSYDAKDSTEKLVSFSALCRKYGIGTRDGELASWEVVQNYYPLLWQAVREGYSNEYLTPDTLAYVERMANRKAAQ